MKQDFFHLFVAEASMGALCFGMVDLLGFLRNHPGLAPQKAMGLYPSLNLLCLSKDFKTRSRKCLIVMFNLFIIWLGVGVYSNRLAISLNANV